MLTISSSISATYYELRVKIFQ